MPTSSMREEMRTGCSWRIHDCPWTMMVSKRGQGVLVKIYIYSTPNKLIFPHLGNGISCDCGEKATWGKWRASFIISHAYVSFVNMFYMCAFGNLSVFLISLPLTFNTSNSFLHFPSPSSISHSYGIMNTDLVNSLRSCYHSTIRYENGRC